MRGDGWAPCLLLGERGLHNEAFPTSTAAPGAGVLREESIRSGREPGIGHCPQDRARAPDSQEGCRFSSCSRNILSLRLSTENMVHVVWEAVSGPVSLPGPPQFNRRTRTAPDPEPQCAQVKDAGRQGFLPPLSLVWTSKGHTRHTPGQADAVGTQHAMKRVPRCSQDVNSANSCPPDLRCPGPSAHVEDRGHRKLALPPG